MFLIQKTILVCRITLQVTDVFLCLIRKTRSVLRAQKNVLEQKPTKALAPTGFLWKPSRPNGRRSSYRMLSLQKNYFLAKILLIFAIKPLKNIENDVFFNSFFQQKDFFCRLVMRSTSLYITFPLIFFLIL